MANLLWLAETMDHSIICNHLPTLTQVDLYFILISNSHVPTGKIMACEKFSLDPVMIKKSTNHTKHGTFSNLAGAPLPPGFSLFVFFLGCSLLYCTDSLSKWFVWRKHRHPLWLPLHHLYYCPSVWTRKQHDAAMNWCIVDTFFS